MSKKKENSAEMELVLLTARLLQKHLSAHGVNLKTMNEDAVQLDEALKPFEAQSEA